MHIIPIICGIFFFLKIIGVTGLLQLNFLNCGPLDDEILDIYKCGLKVVSRNVVAAQILVKLKKTVTECMVDVRFMKKLNGWHPFLYSFRIEFCNFMRNKNRYIIPKLAYENLKRFTNMTGNCPLKKGEVYSFDSGTKAGAQFAIFLKALPLDLGEYGGFIKLYVGGKLRGTLNVSLTYKDYKKLY